MESEKTLQEQIAEIRESMQSQIDSLQAQVAERDAIISSYLTTPGQQSTDNQSDIITPRVERIKNIIKDWRR